MKKSKTAMKRSKKRTDKKNSIVAECKDNSSCAKIENEIVPSCIYSEEEVTSFCDPSTEVLQQTSSRQKRGYSTESDSMSDISDGECDGHKGMLDNSQPSSNQVGSLFNPSPNRPSLILLSEEHSSEGSDRAQGTYERPLNRCRKQKISSCANSGNGSDSSVPRPKKNVSFSSSLVSHFESYTTPQETSFQSSNLPSILTKVDNSVNAEVERKIVKCPRNLYRRDYNDGELKKKLESSVNFREYLHTSSIICDFEDTQFNSTSSSWNFVDPNNASLESNSNAGDGSEIKNSSYFIDDDEFDCKKLEDSSDMKSPFFTSTPCKGQVIQPDLINVCEREILQTLEANDEKLPKITFMVDSMEEDLERLKLLAKRKETDIKKLHESFAEINECASLAEKLNNSICSKTGSNNLNLFSLYGNSKDDLDSSRHHGDFKGQLNWEENRRNDLKEEFDHLRKEISALGSRIVDIEFQSELTNRSLETQETRNEGSNVRTSDSSVQCDSLYEEEETGDLCNRLQGKPNNLMTVSNTWELFESSLLEVQNNLKKDLDHRQEKYADQDLNSRFGASVSDCEYDRKLLALRLSKKELGATWTEQKKSNVNRDINQIAADIQRLKIQRRLPSIPIHAQVRQRESASWDRETKPNLLSTMERPVISVADAITKSKLWRTVKLGIVLPLALVAIGSVNLFLEPNCCDNFYSVSYSPYLEYRYGPPPV